MSAIVAIPARMRSSRFPGKVLADINGKPMLWHVLQGVSTARVIREIYVLTDSEEVADATASWGATVLMTDPDCPSGTARIASVIDRLDAEIVVNVQADEPLINGGVVDTMVEALANGEGEVATPVYQLSTALELSDSNVVKVVRGEGGKALYFSRSPLPHVRGIELNDWMDHAVFWGHVGVYAYRSSILHQYPEMPEGRLESVEKLEQLRLLEAGKHILTVEIDYRPQAVDVPADLEVVKAIIAKSQS